MVFYLERINFQRAELHRLPAPDFSKPLFIASQYTQKVLVKFSALTQKEFPNRTGLADTLMKRVGADDSLWRNPAMPLALMRATSRRSGCSV